ncbi:MAG: hypothetical protein JSS82_13560, partial [Bacteroidetes bacterium]|nr:hypothetical protein [Bacteroidota bacterium]
MINPEKLLAEQGALFEEYVTQKRQQYLMSKEQFLFWNFKGAHYDLKFAIQLYNFSKSFIFFMDEEIKQKMKRMHFFPERNDWFISIDNIRQQFQDIENAGLRIFKVYALLLLDIYLQSKVINEIIDSYDLRTLHDRNEKASRLYKEYRNHFKRVASNKTSFITEYTLLDVLLSLETRKMDQWLGDAKASKKYLLNMVQGKVEKMLLPDLLSCFVVYDKNIPYFYEILDRQNI